jgi:hypothetical protein
MALYASYPRLTCIQVNLKGKIRGCKMSKSSLLWVGVIALLFGTNALAQESPTKWEIGGDYSLVDFFPALPGSSSHVLNGGGLSFVYYRHWLGFKADFQGYGNAGRIFTGVPLPNVPVVTNPIVGAPISPATGTLTISGDLATYLFGVVIKKRGRFEPFGEVLIGGAYSTVFANLFTAEGVVGKAPGNNSFSLTSGVGLDIHINRALSFRPVEVGYLMTQFSNPFSGGAHQNNFRYEAGFTYNWGGGQ